MGFGLGIQASADPEKAFACVISPLCKVKVKQVWWKAEEWGGGGEEGTKFLAGAILQQFISESTYKMYIYI